MVSLKFFLEYLEFDSITLNRRFVVESVSKICESVSLVERFMLSEASVKLHSNTRSLFTLVKLLIWLEKQYIITHTAYLKNNM